MKPQKKQKPQKQESKKVLREIKPEIQAKFQRALKELPELAVQALQEAARKGPQAMP